MERGSGTTGLPLSCIDTTLLREAACIDEDLHLSAPLFARPRVRAKSDELAYVRQPGNNTLCSQLRTGPDQRMCQRVAGL